MPPSSSQTPCLLGSFLKSQFGHTHAIFFGPGNGHPVLYSWNPSHSNSGVHAKPSRKQLSFFTRSSPWSKSSLMMWPVIGKCLAWSRKEVSDCGLQPLRSVTPTSCYFQTILLISEKCLLRTFFYLRKIKKELVFENPKCLLNRRHQGVWPVKIDDWGQQWDWQLTAWCVHF